MVYKGTKKFRLLKWLFLGALLFSGAFGAASLYFTVKVKPVIANEIKALVVSTTDSLYRIEFSGFEINLLTGNASLENVKFIPNNRILEKLVLLKRAPNNTYDVELKKLSVLAFHPLRIWYSQELDIDQIVVNHPKISMINKQFDFNEKRAPRPVVSPYTYISKVLKQLSVQTIDFKEVSFKYIDNNQPAPIADSVEHLNVTLTDWLIDPHSASDTTRLYLLKDIRINLPDYFYATPDSLYHIQLSEMNFSTSTGTLNIDKFALLPRYSEMRFGTVAGFAKDRFNIQMNNLSLEAINLPLYIKKQEVFAKRMRIGEGRVAVFNNNELKKIDSPRIGQYPHQLLQKFGSKLTVGQLDLNNINISYSEFDKKSRQKGRITFEHTSGRITNITNSETQKAKNPVMEAVLTTYMMGQGKLDTKFTFDLLAKDGAFAYSGILHGLNGPALNKVTKPLGMVHIKKGTIKELSFDMKGNEYGATGTMNFKYNGLAIAVLKRDEDTDWLIRQGFLSFMANNFLIKPDNPGKNGILTSAKIDYKRALNRSFFNLIWKSLFQGVKYSVGITPEKEKQIKTQVAKFVKMKTERDQRRAERQKRRALRKHHLNL